MTVRHVPPSAKRLTDRQETRGREMFAAGMSERQVAKALGVGSGTAHRLKVRMGMAVVPEAAAPAAFVAPAANDESEHRLAKPAVPPRIGTRKERLLARKQELTVELAKLDAELDEIAALTDIGDMLEAARLVEPVSETARAIQASHIQVLEDRLADLKKRIPA